MNKILLFSPNYQDGWYYKDGAQLLLNLKKNDLIPEILTFKHNDNFPITEKEIKVKKVNAKKYIWGKLFLIFFFLKNAKKIKVLMAFHINFGSLFPVYIYKTLNRKGFAYIKMDNNHKAIAEYPWERIWLSKISIWNIRSYLMKHVFISKVNLFSIEDDSSKAYFVEKYSFLKDKLALVYNGFTVDEVVRSEWKKKSNYILSAARFGIYEKATDVLLEAFARTKDKHNWKLILCGTIEPSFEKYIENYYINHPDLKERVIFQGHLERRELFDFYSLSKIFVLPSRSEGFPNVISDALIFGNAIITTKVVAISEKINGKMGITIDPDNSGELEKAFMTLINDEEKTKKFGEEAFEFAKNNLDWISNCDLLYMEMKKRGLMN